MDVEAYDINNGFEQIELGSVEDALWVDKLKREQERSIQESKPINGEYPNYFDRVQTDDVFGFAATKSFDTVGECLLNWLLWPNQVPRIAHMSFTQDGEIVWVPNCKIGRVTLVEKKGALIIWAYTLKAGGPPAEKKPF
jgi:hypothetical protein